MSQINPPNDDRSDANVADPTEYMVRPDLSAQPTPPPPVPARPDPTAVMPKPGTPQELADQAEQYQAHSDCFDCDGHGNGYDTLAYGREMDDKARAEARARVQKVPRRRFLKAAIATGTLGYGVFRGSGSIDKSVISSQSPFASKAIDVDGAAKAVPSVDVITENAETVVTEFVEVANELLVPAPVEQRVLVLIELAGGNDGPSMIVPYGDGTYYDVRPNTAVDAETVLPIDSQVGLAPGLAAIANRQIATVEGVGPVEGVLSHFEMVERWERGDLTGGAGERSGFLARLADRLATDNSAVTGLSVAGHTPRFYNSESATLSLNHPNQLRALTADNWIYPYYRNAVRSFGGGPMAGTISQSWGRLFDIGDSMSGEMAEMNNDSAMIQQGRQLGRQLFMAAELIKADIGIKVIHAQLGGFDTHDGHRNRHNQLMETLAAAVDGFMGMLDAAGLGNRALVATSSEFGRRLAQNGSGLDHGAASSMLLAGPIEPGRHGDPSPLSDLDRNGNLKTTVAFDRYLATLAEEWLGVDAGSVLANSPKGIGLF